MGKFNKIYVLSIQLNNEMEATPFYLPIPILALLPSLVAIMLYESFEAFVQGFQAMDSKAPETVKVHLILAPTGSGKTTRFIAGMVRKYPDVLFVLCLPRVLACNVAYYLRSEYGLNVCVKNGKCKGRPTASTQVLIMTYQSAANAFVSGNIKDFACGRQVSLIFDECHETCAQATLLFKVMAGLFSKRPKFLHSLICISATMDAEELSKRLGGVDPSQIQVSQIEAPAKSFKKGETYIIPISVGNFVEDENDEEQDEQQDPFHVVLRTYCSIFEEHVVRIIEQSDTPLSASTVVICAGIKSANSIQERLSATLVKGRKLPVVIWNTFVQSECPIEDKDLPKYHLIILGSHMKLASSITFPKCCRLFISHVMQVATQNLTNSTTVLNLAIIPNSVEQQSVGRGNRDCATEAFIFPIIFPDGFEHPPRLDYPQPEPVSQFMLDFIDAKISGPAKMAQLLEKYRISNATATSLFYSHAPIDLLLAIHSYSRIQVSKENKKFFELSINLLRGFTQACAYISNGAFQIRRNQETVRNDTEFARLLGFFLIDVVNRIIDAPVTRSDKDWNTFFQSPVDIQKWVSEIRELILGDGLGHFRINGEPKMVTPQLLSKVLNFTRQYAPEISPFFMKEQCDKMYVMKPDEDSGKPTIGASKFCGPVLLPFGTIITGGGDPLFPMFFLELPPVVVKNDEKMEDLSTASGGCCAAPAQVIPTSRPYASGGGSAVPAQVRPSQMGSAYESEFQKFVKQFREPHVIEKLRDLMNCIPCNTEFTPESFLNPTKYPNGILPENVKTYQTDLKAVNKQYSLLTFLQELGLMRMNPNGKYQRNF